MANATAILLSQLQQKQPQSVQLYGASTLYLENRSGDTMFIQLYMKDGSEDLGFILDPQEWRRITLTEQMLSRVDITDLVIASAGSIPQQQEALASLVPVNDIETGRFVFVSWSAWSYDLDGGPRTIGTNVPPNYIQQAGPSTGNASGTLTASSVTGKAIVGPFTALKAINTNQTTNMFISLDSGPNIPVGLAPSASTPAVLELDNIDVQRIGYTFGGAGCTLTAWQYAFANGD